MAYNLLIFFNLGIAKKCTMDMHCKLKEFLWFCHCLSGKDTFSMREFIGHKMYVASDKLNSRF